MVITAALFLKIKKSIVSLSTLVTALAWLVGIILAFFVSNIFEPDFIIWLSGLFGQLLLLAVLDGLCGFVFGEELPLIFGRLCFSARCGLGC